MVVAVGYAMVINMMALVKYGHSSPIRFSCLLPFLRFTLVPLVLSVLPLPSSTLTFLKQGGNGGGGLRL